MTEKQRYRVFYRPRLICWSDVYAESESEAIEKVRRGEQIEGTQDSDPIGPLDFRNARAEKVIRLIP